MKRKMIAIKLTVIVPDEDKYLPTEIMTLLNQTMTRVHREFPGNKTMHTGMSTFDEEIEEDESLTVGDSPSTCQCRPIRFRNARRLHHIECIALSAGVNGHHENDDCGPDGHVNKE